MEHEMHAVEVKDLTFSYTGGECILRDISFSVPTGEIFVIGGSSGSGKSTLCYILSGIIPNSIKGEISGKVAVMDIDPGEAGLPQAALRVGMVFQDADSQIICTTVEDELAFGMENLCIPREEIRCRVDELIDEFGLRGLETTNPSHLSGGQKKLLTIASVLAFSPPVLVLDEPMSGLDSESRILVQTAIKQQRDNGLAVIIVEHDLKLVTYADRWLILRGDGAATIGTPSEILKNDSLLVELGVWD